MANYFIYVIEEIIKAYSIIGHGKECRFEFAEKGQTGELSILNDGDKLIGFVTNSVNTFSYIFDVVKKSSSEVHIVKSFETMYGPSLDEVGVEIQENIRNKEQIKSLIGISETQFSEIVSLMTKDTGKNLIDVNDLYTVKDTEYVKHDYDAEELGKILKDMYDNAQSGLQVASIHMFGIKYGRNIIEKGYKASEIIKAANMDDTKYGTELSKALNIYKCLVANTYGISILDEKGLVARPEPQGTRVTGGENILLYGVPGSGKSRYIKDNYPADEKYKERVVFHPDYTYSDFVGQILPRVKGKNLEYEFTPGPFTKILRKAYEDPENSYYLIIEEINRGNAPAIFGEIFQLLDRKNDDADDPTKIGESEYEITNADVAREVYGDENRKVGIPSNLWILATMNTSDQNVFTLDTAFQRRWHMQQIPNIFKEDHAFADTPIMDTSVTWRAFNETINDIIITKNPMSSTEDKRLGTYFIKAQDLQTDSKAFPEKVIKYLWDDAVKFSRDTIFRDKDYPSLELVIEHFEKSSADERLRVFRDGLFKLKDQEAKPDDNDTSNGDKQDQ